MKWYNGDDEMVMMKWWNGNGTRRNDETYATTEWRKVAVARFCEYNRPPGSARWRVIAGGLCEISFCFVFEMLLFLV